MEISFDHSIDSINFQDNIKQLCLNIIIIPIFENKDVNILNNYLKFVFGLVLYIAFSKSNLFYKIPTFKCYIYTHIFKPYLVCDRIVVMNLEGLDCRRYILVECILEVDLINFMGCNK